MENTTLSQAPEVPIPEGQVVATNPIDVGVADIQSFSLDEQLVDKTQPTISQEAFPIVETTPEMVAYSYAAMDFAAPPEYVAQSMSRYVSPSGATTDLAQGIVQSELRALKNDFGSATSSGNVDLSAMFVEAYKQQEQLAKNISAAKAMSIVTTKAVENTATATPSAVENNSIEHLAKVAKEQGHNAARAILLEQRVKAKYGSAVSTTEAVGSLVAAVGGVILAGVANPLLGLAAGAALSVNAIADQKAFRDAIKKHTGIDAKEVWGITDTLEKYNRLLATLPTEQALAIDSKVLDDIIANSDRIPFLGKVFAAGNAASLHVGVHSAPGLDISARTRDWLDGIGVAGDVIGALKYVKYVGSPAKSLEVAAGGDAVGRQVASDIAAGKNTLNVPEAQQIEWSLSNNFEQIIPEGVSGTAGSVQKILMENTKKLLEDLDSRIALTGDKQLQDVRTFVAHHFEQAPTSIAKYDSATGELILQHPGRAAPFTSEETARAFADRLEKETGWKLEVKPTNSPSRPLISIDDVDDYIPESAFARVKVENAELANVVSTGGTAREALYAIQSSSKNDAMKGLAERLLNNKQLNLDAVPITSISDFEKKAAGSKVAGLYRYLEDTIGIDAVRRIPSEATVVHEILHSATSQIIDAVLLAGKKVGKASISAVHVSPEQRFAVKALDKVYKALANSNIKLAFMDGKHSIDDIRGLGLDAAALSEHKDFAKYYGFTNIHEMIAEATTNKDFARVLKNIPIGRIIKDDTVLEMLGGKVRTVWDALVNTWRKMLGVKEGAEASALDVVIENTMKLVDNATEGQRTYFKQLADKKLLTEADFENVRGAAASSTLSHGYYVHLAPSSRQMHSAEDIATRYGGGLDPKHQASMESMHERFVALLQEQRDKKLLSNYISTTIGKLNKAEFQKVNKVLMEGDTVGKEFNDMELFARGIKSDKEKVAYYAFRTLENISLRIKNQHIVKQLSRDGWSQGYVSVGGKTITTPVSQLNATQYVGKKAYNISTGQWDTLKGSESNLFRTRNAIDVGGEDATMFLRTGDDVKIGGWVQQLPMLPGSYRRIYNQDYFGRVVVSKKVNGEMVEDTLHMRTSNSGRDMVKWSEGMNNILKQVKGNPSAVSLRYIEEQVGQWEDASKVLKSIQDGEWDNYKVGSFNHHYDRDSDNYITSLTKAASDSFDFERRARGIKLESIDHVDNTLSPMDALGSELSNISRIRNVAEWRDKWVDVWWNTFKDTIDVDFVRGRRPIEVISDANFTQSMYTGGLNAAKFAESQRKYILQQLGAQTLSERTIEATMRRLTFNHLTKYVKLPLMDEPVHLGHAIRSFDPIQFARSFNFHTMLGAFNPAQLIVQSQAMVNIVAVSPVHGMKSALSMPVIRTALMSDNEKVWRTLATTSGLSGDEFVSVVKSIRRSGLIDGIGATSLHNVEAGAFNMFNGVAGKVSGSGAAFFNRGEEAARITAFETARREWMVANKGADWTTNASMGAILARADDLTQNMSRANLAFYQRGLWSIPAQYLQYNIKLAANIISSFLQQGAGRGFTRGEASRIMGAHLLAYGAAGNGLMMFYDEIAGGYEQATGQKLSEEQKLAIVEGGFAWMADAMSQALTGEEMKLGLGKRLGTFNWYNEILEAAVNSDAAWWEAALGASATIPKKIGSLKYLADPFTTGDLSPEAFLSATNKVLKNTFSSWNNATKAVYAMNNQGRMVSNQGTIMANATTPETFAQAVGMPPAEVTAWYRWMASEKDLRNATKDFAKEYMRLDEIRVDLLRETGGVYNERINEYTKAQAALYKSVPVGMQDTFDAERKRIWALRNSETGKPRLVEKYIELLDKGAKAKDAPLIKNYGVEN